ncbi:TPA: glucose-1-phosphate adenylyltransferase [Candidatus Poribacteria bacterium]|nr:glucose-1-phosphate adenylyltransferase [Candidatus Poribacteria bacterium]
MTREDVIAVILGGGRGERLYPLTKDRAKPAVPIAGKFRLIDIPISNCIHAEINRIFVLTQFNSTSLNRHIVRTYHFDMFSNGYIQILAAQQTLESTDWYQGTADAVRQNIRRFLDIGSKYILILSGDQLYRMNYNEMLQKHIDNNAEITVAVLPVDRDQVKELGILKTEYDGRIVEFKEKPQTDEEIASMEIKDGTLEQYGIDSKGRSHVASMGIYIFNSNILKDAIGDKLDFGKHIIPEAIKTRRVYAYYFDGYWRDVGTIRSFYETNLELTKLIPPFDFYDEKQLIYTRPRFLPGSKINSCMVESSILCEGSIMTECIIKNSVIGVRSIINSGAVIENSIIMGADLYDRVKDQCSSATLIGIGRGSIIRNAIIDKNAKIGCNVNIVNEKGLTKFDGDNYSIRDGIVVVHKNAVIPDDTII